MESDDLVKQLKQIWSLLQEPIFSLKDSKISISSLLISVIVIFLAFKMAKKLGALANKAMSARGIDSGVRDSVDRFVQYAIVCIGVLFSLDNLGVSLTSLAAFGAVLMVGIGFGLQNLAQNFISGVILLLERPIKVGDMINVGSTSGRVVDIRVRATIVQTRDDVTIIVPNSKFISEEVINESYSGQRIRRHIKVGVSYSSDVELVKKILCAAALKQEKVLADPPPQAIFDDFGDSSLNFDLRLWSAEFWEMDLVLSDVRSFIISDLRAAGIEIPFPQRDIHIKNSGVKL
jgi:small-conductance mechanosensitive channel